MAAGMAMVQREVAQFSAIRNNLVTRLDEAVSRAKESLDGLHVKTGQGSDPLVEARRDRDMGVLKSKLDSILGALERAGIVTV